MVLVLQKSLTLTLFMNVSSLTTVGSTWTLFLRGNWGVSQVLPPAPFPGVFCLFLFCFHFIILLLQTRCFFPGQPLSIFTSAQCSWLALWSSCCFCRLVSQYLSTLQLPFKFTSSYPWMHWYVQVDEEVHSVVLPESGIELLKVWSCN